MECQNHLNKMLLFCGDNKHMESTSTSIANNEENSQTLNTETQSSFNIDVDELGEEHPRLEGPVGCNVSLKPHQQSLLARCIKYENGQVSLEDFPSVRDEISTGAFMRTRVGVIGDRVGSGKSYVILSLICCNDISQVTQPMIKSHGYNKVNFFFRDNIPTIKTNMLVVPHNLAIQWQSYIETFGCNIKYKIIKTSKALETLCEGNNWLNAVTELDLIVVTSTLYNRIAKEFTNNKVKLHRVIFDEVDSLSIPGCKYIDANFYWLVTASFGNTLYPRGYCVFERSIERYVWYANGIPHSGFIKNLLTDLCANVPLEYVKTLIVKNKEAFVELSLSLPPMNTRVTRCKTPFTIGILNGMVEKQVLDHLNANDLQGALALINNNQKNNETNIIVRVIEKFSRQANNLNVQIETQQALLYDNESEREAELSRLTALLKEVEHKIDTITSRIKASDVCSICFDDVTQKTVVPCCQNSFCFGCLSRWVSQKHNCPLCKRSLNLGEVLVVDNNVTIAPFDDLTTTDDEDPSTKLDKYENLDNILKQLNSNAKILIFAAYDNSFLKIVEKLNGLRLSFEYLKGNGNHINATVERYKRGETRVLMINPRQYGSGLCLESTSDMIMFHKFDTEIEKQVIGRAQRYGRTEPLNVHYLLYTNEMSK